jgi:biopolymer transport protein ExbD
MKKSVVKITLLLAIGIIICAAIFFVITVKLSQPTTMHLAVPNNSKEPLVNDPEATVNLLLFNNDAVYAYRGSDVHAGKLFNEKDSLLSGYLQIMKHHLPDTAWVVVIKPGANATYKNTVNTLDQMAINDIKRYVLSDITNTEQKFIDSLRKG